MPPLRRITRAKIDFVSLCPRGANTLPVVYKGDDGFEFSMLSKSLNEAGEILSVVYAPGLVDSQGEFADRDVIKEMAYDFARRRGNVDIRHDGKPVPADKAYIAEHFLVAKGDPRFEGWKNYDGADIPDLTGAWAVVVKIEDETLREKYRSGAWNGVSMGGVAAREVVKDEAAAGFLSMLKSLFGGIIPKPANPPTEIDMTAAEVAKIVNDALIAHEAKKAEEAKKAAEAAAAEEAKKAAEGPAVPVFQGDLTKAEDIKKYERELAEFEVRKGLASKDPKVREAALKQARKLAGIEEAPAGGQSNTATDKDGKVSKSEMDLANEAADRLVKASPRYVAPPNAK